MSKVSKVSQVSSPLDDNLLSVSVDVHGNVCEFYASGRRRVFIDFSNDPGLTEQSHKDSCDITYILSQHVRMGGIPPMPEQAFQDFTNVPDYQTCLNTVLQINTLFEQLPLEARVAYDHNPAKFMAAVEDPMHRDTLIKLGVFKPKDGASEGGSAPPPKVDGGEAAGS